MLSWLHVFPFICNNLWIIFIVLFFYYFVSLFSHNLQNKNVFCCQPVLLTQKKNFYSFSYYYSGVCVCTCGCVWWCMCIVYPCISAAACLFYLVCVVCGGLALAPFHSSFECLVEFYFLLSSCTTKRGFPILSLFLSSSISLSHALSTTTAESVVWWQYCSFIGISMVCLHVCAWCVRACSRTQLTFTILFDA